MSYFNSSLLFLLALLYTVSSQEKSQDCFWELRDEDRTCKYEEIMISLNSFDSLEMCQAEVLNNTDCGYRALYNDETGTCQCVKDGEHCSKESSPGTMIYECNICGGDDFVLDPVTHCAGQDLWSCRKFTGCSQYRDQVHCEQERDDSLRGTTCSSGGSIGICDVDDRDEYRCQYQCHWEISQENSTVLGQTRKLEPSDSWEECQENISKRGACSNIAVYNEQDQSCECVLKDTDYTVEESDAGHNIHFCNACHDEIFALYFCETRIPKTVCQDYTCDVNNGQCGVVNKAEGTACVDELSGLSIGYTCRLGECVSGTWFPSPAPTTFHSSFKPTTSPITKKTNDTGCEWRSEPDFSCRSLSRLGSWDEEITTLEECQAQALSENCNVAVWIASSSEWGASAGCWCPGAGSCEEKGEDDSEDTQEVYVCDSCSVMTEDECNYSPYPLGDCESFECAFDWAYHRSTCQPRSDVTTVGNHCEEYGRTGTCAILGETTYCKSDDSTTNQCVWDISQENSTVVGQTKNWTNVGWEECQEIVMNDEACSNIAVYNEQDRSCECVLKDTDYTVENSDAGHNIYLCNGTDICGRFNIEEECEDDIPYLNQDCQDHGCAVNEWGRPTCVLVNKPEGTPCDDRLVYNDMGGTCDGSGFCRKGPTRAPISSQPSYSPSEAPSFNPSTSFPTNAPSTSNPTVSPSFAPSTSQPTLNPSTSFPTNAPSTSNPTFNPTTSDPTVSPTTSEPSTSPSVFPSKNPTTSDPTVSPTKFPTTSQPSVSPTQAPTVTADDSTLLGLDVSDQTSEVITVLSFVGLLIAMGYGLSRFCRQQKKTVERKREPSTFADVEMPNCPVTDGNMHQIITE